MQIKLNAYRRRDGSLMLYINNDRGVSIGISAERGFAPYGRGSTPGQRNLWDAFWPAVRAAARDLGPVDFAAHAEPKVELANGLKLLITDVATIGGVAVGADGAYLMFPDGRVMNCADPIDSDTPKELM